MKLTHQRRLVSLAAGLVLALALAPDLTAGPDDMEEEGRGAWRNAPGPVGCAFPPGTRTVYGFLRTKGCDPGHEPSCSFSIDVVSVKKDSARDFLSRKAGETCRLDVEQTTRGRLLSAWQESERGQRLVRLTGSVTDGVLHAKRAKVVGLGGGYR